MMEPQPLNKPKTVNAVTVRFETKEIFTAKAFK